MSFVGKYRKTFSTFTFPQCKAQCQKTISQYDECNCYKATCQAIDVPDCRPDKPSVNTECNTEPEKEFKDIYTYDGNTGECIRCYSWKYDAIIIPNADVCKLTNLPEKCVSPYTTRGRIVWVLHVQY